MKRRWVVLWIGWCALGALAIAGLPEGVEANDAEAAWVSKIVSVQGRVLARRQGETDWQPVHLGDTFAAGDRLRVEANSRAGMVLSNDALLRLDQNTTIVFTEIEQRKTFIFRLLEGAANFFSHRPRSLKILTPFVNGVVEGTEFFVRVDARQTRIDLFEGRILAENPYGELQLGEGQGALAMAGSAPQRQILVRPRDSVQWALYYPPLLTLVEEKAPADIAESLAWFNRGQTADAIAALEQIEPRHRDATFWAYRAALLLHVGRVSEAESDIRKALAANPDSGDALALQAVIAVVQNRTSDALRIAQEAVRVAPRSAAARIALSYALQTDFKIQEALQAAREAVTQTPANGVAWARLAELQLCVGELDAGIQAARRAGDLNAHIAHAHSVLGFAYLTQIKTDKAREAFIQAITLDSAAPLPRLGLGLAKIRDGDLKEGRAEIEIAAGLDPGNALIRSYLGKAYFDEKRGPLDGQQLQIAKTLDPNDPTPWFYDAIRKQTLNRPVEALRDLQKSIELNDNRAVYRSRLMLDQDLAARSASLGRIYSDLGFQQRALLEGWKSVHAEPGNYSGHRFLADSYFALPRHDIARVSELLQSQLLQPLNITPVQPQLAENNLLILEGAGPADPSLNEFNPMFVRDRLALQASGIAGNHSTIGDELTQSGLWGKFSYSLGQFHYETDGFRANNDLENDTYNAFVQVAVSPKASIQAEYRHQESKSGDLNLRFDPNDFLPKGRTTIRRPSARLGFHYEPVPHHEIIASVSYRKLDYQLSNQSEEVSPDFQFAFDSVDRVESEAYGAELQYLRHLNRLNIVAGAGYFDEDQTSVENFNETFVFPPDDPEIFTDTNSFDSDTRYTNAYLYSNIKLLRNLIWDFGISYDYFRSSVVDRDLLNPKTGLIWEVLPHTTLRAAAFRTVKRPFALNQTIEPTQVAGFNQFFDDLDGSKTKRYGIALDQILASHLAGGVEFSWRDLEIPVSQQFEDDEGNITFTSGTEKQDEVFHRAYLYWTYTHSLSFSTEYQFEIFNRELTELSNPNEPTKISTHRLPLGVNYYHASGFFSRCKATYVDQEVDSSAGGESAGDEHFWVVDASMGYRLPKRRGIVSVGVKNLFDKEFRYQDVNFQSGEPLVPLFQPSRVTFVQLTLSF